MALFGGDRIHANPTTQTQLRAALAAAQRQNDDLADDVAATNAALQELSDFVGPIAAVFDSAAGIGQPVYVSSASHVDLADADSPATAGVVGLASAATAAGATGEYLAQGVVSAADWTTATGSASLTPGSLYFLSGTTGRITTTAPSTGTVVRVGRALTANDFLVSIEPGIKL